jgi:transposase
MDHLDEITTEELQAALDEVEGKKPTQRLLAAIAYKNGITQTELAEWHGVQRRTIYNWLTRLDADSLATAAEDARRPGRPRRLSERQQETLQRSLRRPPSDAGYDESAWSPALVQRFVAERFGVDYSRPSCRRFMTEAGLR